MLSVPSRKLAERILSLPALAAASALNLPPIERRLHAAHLRHRQAHAPNIPTLDAADAEIVAGLRADGLVVTHLDALNIPASEAMLDAARTLGECGAKRLRGRDGTGVGPSMAGADDLMRFPEVFRWGLQARLLRLVEAYLGLPVGYDGVNLLYTRAQATGREPPLWHLDREDRRMIKIAVYMNPVDDDGGPLQVIKRSAIEAEPGARSFTYGRISHAGLERRRGAPIGDADIVNCTGPAGTVVLCDTARLFHRGKPAVARDRLAAYFCYFSRIPRHPFFCERSGLSRAQLAELCRDLTAHQQACVQWRECLPTLARLIPPSPDLVERIPPRA